MAAAPPEQVIGYGPPDTELVAVDVVVHVGCVDSALEFSPFTKPGTKNAKPYNHYALLCSIENAFGLEHLGLAGQPGLECFGKDVYNR